MSAQSKNSAADAQYAQAMLDLANQAGQAAVIGAELTDLAALLKAEADFGIFLRNPAISHAKRQAALDHIFQGRVSPLLINLLGVLNNKGRLGLLEGIAASYAALFDKQIGRIQVDLTVARELDAANLEQVRQSIGTALKKDAVVRQKVDESILGGLVLRIGDKLMDASVRAQLQTMKERFLAAAPK